MRVLVCGSQTWDDAGAIAERVATLDPASDVVIHGGAKGADLTAAAAARKRGVHPCEVKPIWDRYGKGAGHVRNAIMVNALAPDVVWAFSHGTSGTQGTIDAARRAGIPVEVTGQEAT